LSIAEHVEAADGLVAVEAPGDGEAMDHVMSEVRDAEPDDNLEVQT
jgi:hypothetical protein